MFFGPVPETSNEEEAGGYIALKEPLKGAECHQLRPVLYGADTDEAYP